MGGGGSARGGEPRAGRLKLRRVRVRLPRRNEPAPEAIQKADEVRFVPIVPTTMTAIGGLLPPALEGSSRYSPLAWVIIGGVASSPILARLVTPVVYRLIPPAVDLKPAVAVSG